jgi:hypothetical protein
MEFGPGDHVIVNPLRLRKELISELESNLVLFYTGRSRVSYDRKPSPGMILKAAEKYLIDLPRSFMIGDKVTDRIDLPGLRSYLVQGTYPISGKGCYSSFADLARELQRLDG